MGKINHEVIFECFGQSKVFLGGKLGKQSQLGKYIY